MHKHLIKLHSSKPVQSKRKGKMIPRCDLHPIIIFNGQMFTKLTAVVVIL